MSRADEAFIEQVIQEIATSRASGENSGTATPRSASSGTSTPAEHCTSQTKSIPSPNRCVPRYITTPFFDVMYYSVPFRITSSATFLDATMHLYKRSCPSVGP